jgi:hypothetical protein
VPVGQPELRDKLHLQEMRQVAQRISMQCMLRPLNRDGLEGYVAHRLHVAGGSPDRVRFSREALDVVFDTSGGIPRVINRVCDRALHHGYVRRATVIDEAAAALACADMELRRRTAAPVPDSWLPEIDVSVQRAARRPPHGWLRRVTMITVVLLAVAASALGATLAAKNLMAPVSSPFVRHPEPPPLPPPLVVPPLPEDAGAASATPANLATF